MYIGKLDELTDDLQKSGKTVLDEGDEQFIFNMFSQNAKPLYSVELDRDSDVEDDFKDFEEEDQPPTDDEDAKEEEEEKKRAPNTRTLVIKDQKTADAMNQRLYDMYGIEANVTVTQRKEIFRTDAAQLGRKNCASTIREHSGLDIEEPSKRTARFCVNSASDELRREASLDLLSTGWLETSHSQQEYMQPAGMQTSVNWLLVGQARKAPPTLLV